MLVVKWKKLWQVVDIKKRKVAAQKKQYGRKYPSVSANQAEIVALDFGELTKRLQSRELSATQVLHAFYAKAVEVDKATNAVTEFIDEALKEARTLDAQPREGQGPLHGLPVSLKEHIFLTGKSCTAGISDNLKNTCSKDAEIVVALKRLGAIPFCRTNLPQACISFDCSNPIHGKTANPGSLLRGPGGSSGGEGALIAGGGSVIGIGKQKDKVAK